MKLQKRLNRKVKDKEYVKWQVVLAPEDVDKLGWKEGTELESKVKDDKLTLVPKTHETASKNLH